MGPTWYRIGKSSPMLPDASRSEHWLDIYEEKPPASLVCCSSMAGMNWDPLEIGGFSKSTAASVVCSGHGIEYQFHDLSFL